MLLRQFAAAISRSGPVISKRTSFAASSKVAADTAGPTSGAVPKAGGAPGVGAAGLVFALLHAPAAAASRAHDPVRNCRLESDMAKGVSLSFPPQDNRSR